MKKTMDVLIWALLLFLITPSGMALASWNAIPGDPTYAWKLSLEKVFLKVLSPSDKLQSTTQVKIAERRFDEAERVLDSEYAVEGLDNLNKQLAATSTNIKKIDKAQSRSEVTDQYLVSLKKMSVSLDEKKSLVKTGQIATTTQKDSPTSTRTIVQNTYNIYNNINSAPNNTSNNTRPSNPNTVPTTSPNGQATPTNTYVPTAAPTVNQQQPTAVPTENPAVEEPAQEPTQEVVDAIEETQQNIEDVIEILEQVQAQQEENSGNQGGQLEEAWQQIQENSGNNGNNGGNNGNGNDENNGGDNDGENNNQENNGNSSGGNDEDN